MSIFRTLRKLCAAGEVFPRSFGIPSADLRERSGVAGGGFGDVFRATYRQLNVALKLLRVSSVEQMSSKRKMFFKEAVSWKYLSHPNIVPFLGVEADPSTLCLVSEWMENGTIASYLLENPDAARLYLLLDIAQGLQYLHSDAVCIIHGDLKSFNILINAKHRACLADFGLASIAYDSNAPNITSSFSTRAMTIRWTAPELLNPERFGLEHVLPSRASDVYAFGMVAWEVSQFTSLVFFRY